MLCKMNEVIGVARTLGGVGWGQMLILQLGVFLAFCAGGGVGWYFSRNLGPGPHPPVAMPMYEVTNFLKMPVSCMIISCSIQFYDVSGYQPGYPSNRT